MISAVLNNTAADFVNIPNSVLQLWHERHTRQESTWTFFLTGWTKGARMRSSVGRDNAPAFSRSFREPRWVEVGGSATGYVWGQLSARLLQGIDDLLQDVGAVVCDLLEDRVGVLLQLAAFLLTHLQLSLQLERKTWISFQASIKFCIFPKQKRKFQAFLTILWIQDILYVKFYCN